MDKKINLTQLADLLSQAGGMSKSASEQFVKNFFDIISQNVLSDGLVKVKGLGTFKLLQMEDRESVNVNTGERFTIEGHQKISFTPDSDLKEVINKPFAAFETVEITSEQADTLASMNTVSQQEEESDESSEVIAKEVIPVAAQEKVTVVEDMPLESGKVNDNEAKVEPTVKDVTQKRGVRFLIKLLIWILAILLIVPLLLYLFWPLIGNSVLEFVERDIKTRNKTEYVADSIRSVPKPVMETAPVTPQPSKPAEQPQSQEKPSQTAPAQQQAPVQTTPAQQPSKPAETTPAKPAASTVTTGQGTSGYPAVKLNSADTAKDLKDFTEADTVNFIMDGDLTVHTLKSDETITKLALKYYGTKKLWPYIVKYNNVKDASKLHEGAKIRIPVLKAK
jgi:nucleoid DNA-binding protein